ncbi:S-layer homology domain-containing protein [Patescibacteria group bacterium]
MKKILATLAILGLLLVSNTAFAQEYELLIVFGSDPAETDIADGEATLNVHVGDEITFTRKIVSIGMDTFTWDWNWDSNILDCLPQPDLDSPDFVCTAIAGGTAPVSITVNATMDDQSQRTVESKLIYVTIHDDLPAVPDYYGHTNHTAIQYLYDNEIVEGYPDGTFKPDNPLTRAELMKILVLGAGFDPDAEVYNGCFPDVEDEWFARYICFALENGWVEGYPRYGVNSIYGSFKPDIYVVKVEAIKMLLEVFDVELMEVTTIPYDDLVIEGWYLPYLLTAYEMGLLEEEGRIYNPGNDITRGQVSENIYRLLKDEEGRFYLAYAEMICDIEAAGEQEFIEMTPEEIEPLLIEKLVEHGFNMEIEGAFDALTSRHTYPLDIYLNTPELFCV